VSLALLKNTVWGVFGEVAVRGAKIAQIVLIARLLGSEDLGRFNYALSLAGLFSVLFDFGIATVAVKEMARRPNAPVFRLYGRVKLFSSGFGILLIGGAATLADVSPADAWLAFGMGLYLTLNDLSTYVLVSYRIRGEFWRETALRSASAVLQLVACVGAIILTHQLEVIVAALVAAATLGLLPLVKEWQSQPRPHGNEAGFRAMASAWRQCLPLAGTVVAGSVYMNFDVVVLARHVSMEQVGWYSVAVKAIFSLLIMPLHYFQLACLPAFAANLEVSIASARGRWLRGFVMSSTVGAALSILTAILAEPLLMVLFGKAFLPAAPILVMFCAVGFMFYLYTPLSQWLLLQGHQRYTLYIQIVAMGANLSLVLLCVPRWGIWGAVGAAFVTHFSIAAIHAAVVFRSPDFVAHRSDLQALARLIGGVAGAFVLLHFQTGGPWLSKLLAVVAFGVLAHKESKSLWFYLRDINRKIFPKDLKI
jgi:PST family polysaccharide transporter